MSTTTHKTKNRLITSLRRNLLTVLAIQLAVFGLCILTSSASVSAAPGDLIPAGCPGSTRPGPPSPGTCSSIPAGCLGTTQSGPKAPGTHCPYTALPIPAGCPGSKQDGPPIPPNICDKIPAGCPGSSHTGPRRPASECQYSATATAGGSCDPKTDATCAVCNGTSPSAGCVKCKNGLCGDTAADPDAPCNGGNGCDLVKKYINPFINLLSMVLGLIAAISIIMGGIQYASSTGDPQKVSAAKQRIINTLIALVAYFFLYGFLQFLIPGGLFNK